jgi:hypothetical protein
MSLLEGARIALLEARLASALADEAGASPR